jgi:hypothetical protein
MRRNSKRDFFLSSRTSTPTAQIIAGPIDKGLLPNDGLNHFHPTHPGQVLDGRFRTIAKLGFGAGSTVWLAENLEL